MEIQKTEIQHIIRRSKVDILRKITEIMDNCYFDDDDDGNSIITDEKLNENKEILSVLDYEIDSLARALSQKRDRIENWVNEDEILQELLDEDEDLV